MARTGALNNHWKLDELVQKYKLIKFNLKKDFKNIFVSLKQKYNISMLLYSFPRRASLTRLRNRCFITGRPRGYYRLFGMSRIMLRQMASSGQLPGVIKSSW